MEIALVFVWLLFGTLSVMVANRKRRNVYGWAIVGFLFGPSALVIALMDSASKAKSTVAIGSGNAAQRPTRLPAVVRMPCPFCAELVMPEAKICRFCNRDLVATSSSPSAQQDTDNRLTHDKSERAVRYLFLLVLRSADTASNRVLSTIAQTSCLFPHPDWLVSLALQIGHGVLACAVAGNDDLRHCLVCANTG